MERKTLKIVYMGKEIKMDAVDFGLIIGAAMCMDIPHLSKISSELFAKITSVECGTFEQPNPTPVEILDRIKEEVSDLWFNIDGSDRPSGELLVIREVNKKIDRLKENWAT